MDRIELNSDQSRVVFRSATRADGEDPYAGSSFVVELHAEGLQSTRAVFMFGFDWDALIAFFEDLANSWRGWDGLKQWASVERDLSIAAESDDLGHCLFQFVLRDGPVHTWETSLGPFSVDSGEDLSNFASAVRSWAPA